jgi:hypothetical protein
MIRRGRPAATESDTGGKLCLRGRVAAAHQLEGFSIM